mmetsp:Transcript_9643/g.18353  ORF Transcript_9643/g.18353 Transcript_9643/m.18353 type:complete len:250 (+) Transcript_9643:27-776(+)|eukprot:CAMPEP_0175172592 /NCGR_PEP_ID=MMETSP0087-20121206/31522_1 /TAXON_ID=136419 /ORGANISM="Unknown Unknown, Strain D1" /LENGTH=249 /DNA_ID=CAMNT_0016463687 /DNA_START=28 /DNA_END=777 /DNA_ORIENTATION=+
MSEGESENKSVAIVAKNGLPVNILASLAVLVQGIILCDKTGFCEGQFGFAIAVGAVALVLGLVQFFAPLEEQLRYFLSVFTFFWWAVGTSYLTFSGPFKGNLLNGFFASWIGLISAIFLAGPAVSKYVTQLKNLQMEGLLILVAIVAAIDACSPFGQGLATNNTIVLIISLVIVVFVVILIAMPAAEHRRLLTGLLVGFTIFNAGYSTFFGPFLFLGNGYLAVWSAVYYGVKLFLPSSQGAELQTQAEA